MVSHRNEQLASRLEMILSQDGASHHEITVPSGGTAFLVLPPGVRIHEVLAALRRPNLESDAYDAGFLQR